MWGSTNILLAWKQGNKLLREEGKGKKGGQRLLIRISVTRRRHSTFHRPHGVTLHSILRMATLHIPFSRIPVGIKGPGPAGTRRDSSPTLDLNSHKSGLYGCSSWGCGPFRISFVVFANGFHLGQDLLGFPRWVGKSPPLYQILQPTSHPPPIQNFSTSHSSSHSMTTGSGGGVTWLGSGSSPAACWSETGNVRCFWIVAGISS